MAHVARGFLLEETIDYGMLHETADQRLVDTTSMGQFRVGNRAIIRDVRDQLVMIYETETEGICELRVYLINHPDTVQQNQREVNRAHYLRRASRSGRWDGLR